MEKAIFLDKFMQFPKNFSKIASFLTNRSTKDCVRFYYDSKAGKNRTILELFGPFTVIFISAILKLYGCYFDIIMV